MEPSREESHATESGWTMYLLSPASSYYDLTQDADINHTLHHDNDDDDSTASDASSGRSHHRHHRVVAKSPEKNRKKKNRQVAERKKEVMMEKKKKQQEGIEDGFSYVGGKVKFKGKGK